MVMSERASEINPTTNGVGKRAEYILLVYAKHNGSAVGWIIRSNSTLQRVAAPFIFHEEDYFKPRVWYKQWLLC